ncbi:MAG: DUF418 domain-containing protein [Myxococcales bacterium]|nr:DUF418 domain-containing protein [Myxococcales bacterium]
MAHTGTTETPAAASNVRVCFTVSRPETERERHAALDALRGVALLGVLLANVDTEFRASPFERFLPSMAPATGPEAWAAEALVLVCHTKPLLVFSFLFGFGLAAQEDRGSLALARRLAFLFLIGVVHFVLLWSGDVLALYAVVAGFAAILLRLSRWGGLPAWSVVLVALALFGVQALPIPYPRPFDTPEAMAAHVDAAHRIYGAGDYASILRFRLETARPALAALSWSVPRTLGLFLLGASAWRYGLFKAPRVDARLPTFALVALLLGAGAAWAAARSHASGVTLAALTECGELGLAAGLGAAVLWLADRSRVGKALGALAPIGRMTLTSYLVQSVLLGLIFYGYGGGLFGRVSHVQGACIALGIFAVQAAFAAAWLTRFRLGPVEWLWRSVTDRERKAMRRS